MNKYDSEIAKCDAAISSCKDYIRSGRSDVHGACLGLMDNANEKREIQREQYEEFLRRKLVRFSPVGFEVKPDVLCPHLMPFQRDLVHWALRRGRSALWEDCGLGKTLQQLEWANQVATREKRPVLIFAPLAVAHQTADEGRKFGINVNVAWSQSQVVPGVNVTNYEKLDRFPNPEEFSGLVLDESSILKAMDGKTRAALTQFAKPIGYRLCCTATPAPNDFMELGNHAEFLGVMTAAEMLAMFFVHDGGDTSKWRLKKHATDEFYKWLCSWAAALRRPSDLNYDDGAFLLPNLNIEQISVESGYPDFGTLFPVEAKTLQERRDARRGSLQERVRAAADLANCVQEPWIVWCNLNSESEALRDAIPGSVEVSGSDDPEYKSQSMLDFSRGKIRVLITKPTIAGFGMNWQHCRRVAFVGLSDSYEQFYQAIRRCWRYGQKRDVYCYVITSAAEGAIVRNIERKERESMALMDGMVQHMRNEMQKEVRGLERQTERYEQASIEGRGWTARLGDCIDVTRSLPSESIDYTIFSPPFASLYTYSNSERDMGNATGRDEFAEHFGHLVPELYRTLKSGRLLSFHCMNLPATKERDGFIGIHDFRGDLIRIFQRAGFIFHSEVCIWKDPVTAMQRTKSIGLLYKQLKKDSCLSRQGIPDYLVTMRKPGDNAERVTKNPDDFPVSLWQRYASPVWMDINQSKTLGRDGARDEEDERHICPLQLDVIERAVRLWTNPGDLVFSPFMGIGSEGFVSITMGRTFLGVELKRSYWEQAIQNLKSSELISKNDSLFTDETIHDQE